MRVGTLVKNEEYGTLGVVMRGRGRFDLKMDIICPLQYLRIRYTINIKQRRKNNAL